MKDTLQRKLKELRAMQSRHLTVLKVLYYGDATFGDEDLRDVPEDVLESIGIYPKTWQKRTPKRLPRGRDLNKIIQLLPPQTRAKYLPLKDPDIILFTDEAIPASPPTVERRVLGESLINLWKATLSGDLSLMGVTLHDTMEVSHFQTPSASSEEVEEAFEQAENEVQLYNDLFGYADHWNPVTGQWETRPWQIGDEVDWPRWSTDDLSDSYGEFKEERPSAPNHLSDDRWNALRDHELEVLQERGVFRPLDKEGYVTLRGDIKAYIGFEILQPRTKTQMKRGVPIRYRKLRPGDWVWCPVSWFD